MSLKKRPRQTEASDDVDKDDKDDSVVLNDRRVLESPISKDLLNAQRTFGGTIFGHALEIKEFNVSKRSIHPL